MTRLLGIVHMNPEKDPSTWDHTDVSFENCACISRYSDPALSNTSPPTNSHTQEDLYGIGGVRTPERFYEVFGIDVVNKKTERHLCRFVDTGIMHNQFQKLVRRDGMGVDYSKVTYKFKDPAPNEK